MARRMEEAENHWPGFVDALSTIVMVVTFLLIILGIVIFVISKNIARQAMADAASQARRNVQMQPVDGKRQVHERPLEKKSISAANASHTASGRTRETKSKRHKMARAENPAENMDRNLADELTQDSRVKSRDKRAVRSRAVEKSRRITIAPPEKTRRKRRIRVSSSQAALSLMFKGGVIIDQKTGERIQSFIASLPDTGKGGKYEVRAFFHAGKGSISEARRQAYYRALSTRNQLLARGIAASNIAIRISESENSADAGRVNVYLK